ncbi:putative tetratricopeptide-like helical domain-containing protein [Rosa chinensis]|uniref:Putative tetratricopeptide-like helical domain-containing protein n=1 Tax=Rosa chinensis TaxID=74649 RepID=A0A2P6RV45_ROSCH|nr:pentatricopeptide repeat-containing protein At3g02650, mitochondrial [Rosa chinensis]PRQ50298.1 putative tetratricopeptide-like helical domain-containing protein [Rosa chinensis]
MWRSVAARSSRASLSAKAAHNFGATQNPKVLSSKTLVPLAQSSHFPARSPPCQNPRFFSQVSEDLSYSDTAEPPPPPFSENDDAQMDGFAPGDGVDGVSEQLGCGEIGELGEEEEEVHEIDVEKLEGLLSLLHSSADGSLESSFRDLDLTLHEEFVVRVLETPLIVGENLIRFFKWGLKEKPEFRVNKQILDALVIAMCGEVVTKKDMYSLWDLVKGVGEKEGSLLNVDILNVLMSAFAKLGEGKAALEVLNKFDDFGCIPNADSYYYAIEGLCRSSDFDCAKAVCEKMIGARSSPDAEKVGRILSRFCKAGMAKVARSVYLLLKEEKQCRPRSSVHFLIRSLSREDENVKLALDLLEDIDGEARKYAIKPFSAVVQGLCRIKDVAGARKLLLEMAKKGPPPGNAVFNSVINGYSKAGDMQDAIEMMKLMESRGLKPDVFTYTVIMSGYAKGGQMEEACNILSEAKKKHAKLTPVTYHTLISSFCKLEQFDKALELFHEMKDYGVQPTTDEYNKLIQSLCLKALDWETSEKLLEEMKDSGLYLNGITRGLIRAVKELQTEKVETEKIVAEA